MPIYSPLIRPGDKDRKPPFGSRIDPQHPLARGMVGCWLLNEGGGNTAFNLAPGADGRGHGTLYNGPTWDGDGLNFDGSNDFVDFGDFYYSDIQTFSIKFIPIGAPNYTTLFLKNNVVNTVTASSTTQKEIWLYYGTSNRVYFYCYDSSGVAIISASSGSNFLVLNKINTITVVMNGSGNTGYLYINNSITSFSQSGTLNNSNSGVQIGVRNTNQDVRYFNGIFKNLAIWTIALNSSQVQQYQDDPYCFIQQPRKYWFVPEAAPASTYNPGPALLLKYRRIGLG